MASGVDGRFGRAGRIRRRSGREDHALERLLARPCCARQACRVRMTYTPIPTARYGNLASNPSTSARAGARASTSPTIPRPPRAEGWGFCPIRAFERDAHNFPGPGGRRNSPRSRRLRQEASGRCARRQFPHRSHQCRRSRSRARGRPPGALRRDEPFTRGSSSNYSARRSSSAAVTQAAFSKIAQFSFVRMERSRVAARLQPGFGRDQLHRASDARPSAGAGRGRWGNRLVGDIGYSILPAAGGGAAVTVSGANSIVTSLATLARAAAPAPASTAPVDPLSPSPDPLAPAPRPRSRRANTFSYNCADARTPSEEGGVRKPRSLQHSIGTMAAHYKPGLGQCRQPHGRPTLRRTRDRFLAYRERCPSDACIADAYRGRIREIDDIVRASR